MSASDSVKRALVTGISGQDGSFLTELLLERGYEVVGLAREPSGSLGCSEHLRERVSLIRADLSEPWSLTEAIVQTGPHEIYHLAGPSFIPSTWEDPAGTFAAIVGSCATILQAVCEADPAARVFVAASGAIFGNAQESPQREDTPCRPSNPYAIAKLAAHQLVGAMRERHGMHASSGILFNHESERRPERFVTRRVSRAAAAIALGLADELTLGSLGAVRDWSFAGDTMRGAWLMLQQEVPGDYVLASGVGRTVAELARVAFAVVGLDSERYVRCDEQLLRPEETAVQAPTPSVGDASRARQILGWRPTLSFEQLVERMVRADMRALESVPRAS